MYLKGKRAKTLQKAKARDESGNEIPVTWFNQPYLKDILIEDQWFYMAGKLDPYSLRPQILNPEIESAQNEDTVHLARITPIYHLTFGVRQKWLRSKIKWLLDNLDLIVDVTDQLSPSIRERYELLDFAVALKNIHFPSSYELLEEAKKRLAFEEMFNIQILILEKQKQRFLQNARKYDKILLEANLDKVFGDLPFKPTNDQIKACEEIKNDLATNKPMRRLLQGDVGTGKTLVAVLASYMVAAQGGNVAILAPTVILAQQLYGAFNKFITDSKISIDLTTGGQKVKNQKQKDTDFKGYITIGTHALLYSQPQSYDLLIVDEQHRFGVKQRQQLQTSLSDKSFASHYLAMTATPIPRTLANVLFADMDLSILEDKPKSQIPIKTYIVPEHKRQDCYAWIKGLIQNNEKCFWLCPRVNEVEGSAIKSVESTIKELEQVFADLKIGLIHGKLSSEAKNKTIDSFRNNKLNLLIATTVIEVGIDIPDANIIVIEGAEMFGLAQLHQIRGRVGRADRQGYCFLFTSPGAQNSQFAIQRLKFFTNCANGIKIAEFDLKSRGPGEVYGFRQSGIPNLKLADINNLNLIHDTREAAESTMTKQ